ncbi:type 1 glutamine amidotransferase domain-containing protein [Companilactobacillus nantensis]|uniref:ThiJ PfpI family protein n=1 Tax=Companilactobacillus nantensis DSM 16982 TaxID=1423774 RepID=A0A0R1W8Y1_9LACO|nr:type 1 glutamine amidotransferase domain-containing protein [Companilactobacillus nantensis]KRM13957.1 ThiJ PfpI family protein [Companilactobacillus nantensis DSM 16982]GEO63579.1 peptidase C56 [Companilactobacillus nantensis]
MKKILVVLTNKSQYGYHPEATGLWLGEATEFVRIVEVADFKVDYVSPKGGYVPIDPRSFKYATPNDLTMYQDPDFQNRALANTLSPDEIDPRDYAAIYYTGGHGVMWDFPYNEKLQQISRQIYQNDGFLTSVCHGISGLLYIKDDQGQYLIRHKHITGFTNAEEQLSGKKKYVPFLNEEVAQLHGAIFSKKRPYAEYALADGQFITGQNPFSPAAVAKLLVKKMQ